MERLVRLPDQVPVSQGHSAATLVKVGLGVSLELLGKYPTQDHHVLEYPHASGRFKYLLKIPEP